MISSNLTWIFCFLSLSFLSADARITPSSYVLPNGKTVKPTYKVPYEIEVKKFEKYRSLIGHFINEKSKDSKYSYILDLKQSFKYDTDKKEPGRSFVIVHFRLAISNCYKRNIFKNLKSECNLKPIELII